MRIFIEYLIPQNLTSKIVEVDEYLYDKNKETCEFLILNIAKKLGNNVNHKNRKTYLTQKAKQVIKQCKLFSQSFCQINIALHFF